MDHPTVAKLDTRVTVVENELRGNGRKGICEIVEGLDVLIHEVKDGIAEIKSRRTFLQDTKARVVFWITVLGFLLVDVTTFVYLLSCLNKGP